MTPPEVWLRGAVPRYPALLQPVAHSLMQVREEVAAELPSCSPEELWVAPPGRGSAGFHLRHAAGSLERLYTYARGEGLSEGQLAALRAEREPDLVEGAADRLRAHFDSAVEQALRQVRDTPESSLLEPRAVGRAQLPATVLGLLFHGAEHAQRHVGQFITTLRLLRS
jgi:uncharacterized damage-inducible protein DinB